MARKMEEIIKALAQVNEDLKKIDLTKEKDVSKISKMATDPIKGIDDIAIDETFNGDALDEAIKMFGEASKKVESYDASKDAFSQMKDDGSNKDEVKKVTDARSDVKSKISGKYDELTKKKAVIEKYMGKYNPEELIRRQNSKKELNKDNIEKANKMIKCIKDFKSRVKGELDEIQKKSNVIKELANIEKQAKAIQAKENKIAMMKAQGYDVKALEDEVSQEKTALSTKCTKLKEKDSSLVLDSKDMTTLVTQISAEKTKAENAIVNMKGEIDAKLVSSEKNFGYVEGFESYMQAKFSGITGEEYPRALDDAEIENAEVSELTNENKKIDENTDTLQKGVQVIESGSTRKYTDVEPTEEEIQAAIAADPTLGNMLPATLDEKDIRNKIYEHILESKGIEAKGFHPIAKFRARFDKKAEENWRAAYEKPLRDAAIKKIKDERRQAATKNDTLAKHAESRQTEFVTKLRQYVMGLDKDEVEQMEQGKDKGIGLSKVYGEMDKDDDGSR